MDYVMECVFSIEIHWLPYTQEVEAHKPEKQRREVGED